MSNSATLLQDKAADILDIGRRLLHCLSESPRSETELGDGAVIVAAALTPSQLVRFAHQGVVAVVAETGIRAQLSEAFFSSQGPEGRDKSLRFALYPGKKQRDLSVFRNTAISNVAFEDSGDSTILSGAAHVGDGPNGRASDG